MQTDLRQSFEIEILFSFDQDMDVADTDCEQIDSSLLNKTGRQLRDRSPGCHSLSRLPRKVNGQPQPPPRRRDNVQIQSTQRRAGCNFRLGGSRISRHNEIKSGEYGTAHPIVVRAFIENEPTRYRRAGRRRFSQSA